MTISVGTVFNTLFNSGETEVFTNRSFNFEVTSATSGTVVFDHAGGDNQGILLDNVRLSRVSVVPEAGTLALILPALGLVGIVVSRTGAVRRRK